MLPDQYAGNGELCSDLFRKNAFIHNYRVLIVFYFYCPIYYNL